MEKCFPVGGEGWGRKRKMWGRGVEKSGEMWYIGGRK